MITIRPATQSDVLAIVSIHQSAFKDFFEIVGKPIPDDLLLLFHQIW